MASAPSRQASCRTLNRRWIRFACSLAICFPAPLLAQRDEAIAEALAGVLAASDARNYDGPLFRAASRNADPIVRSQPALALGRIGQRGGAPLLLALLADADTGVAANAAFAL